MSLNVELLRRIVYSSFRRAWEEDHQSLNLPPTTICVTEISQCLLKSWFERTIRVPPSENKIILMVLGDSTHYLMKDYFPLGKGENFGEKLLNNEIKIVGRADRVLEKYIIEFKTVSRIPDNPYETHINQVQLYLWLFEKEKAFIVYVSRTNGNVKIFEIMRDDSKVKELLERAKILAKSLKEGVVPKPEESVLCNFCEYKELCKEFRERNGARAGI